GPTAPRKPGEAHNHPTASVSSPPLRGPSPTGRGSGTAGLLDGVGRDGCLLRRVLRAPGAAAAVSGRRGAAGLADRVRAGGVRGPAGLPGLGGVLAATLGARAAAPAGAALSWAVPRRLWLPMLLAGLFGAGFAAFFQFAPILAERRGTVSAGLLYSVYGVGII